MRIDTDDHLKMLNGTTMPATSAAGLREHYKEVSASIKAAGNKRSEAIRAENLERQRAKEQAELDHQQVKLELQRAAKEKLQNMLNNNEAAQALFARNDVVEERYQIWPLGEDDSDLDRTAWAIASISNVKNPKVQVIRRILCRAFGTSVRHVFHSEFRTADRVKVRQLAFVLTKRLLGKSLPETGRLVGRDRPSGRAYDHTTVLHAVRKYGAFVESAYASLEARAALAKVEEVNQEPETLDA